MKVQLTNQQLVELNNILSITTYDSVKIGHDTVTILDSGVESTFVWSYVDLTWSLRKYTDVHIKT